MQYDEIDSTCTTHGGDGNFTQHTRSSWISGDVTLQLHIGYTGTLQQAVFSALISIWHILGQVTKRPTARSVQRPGYQLQGRGAGLRFPAGVRDFSVLWGLPSLLYNGHRELFPGGKGGRGVKLTTHLYLVPKLKMMELYLHSSIGLHAWCLIN
jgi:hypothetical protein